MSLLQEHKYGIIGATIFAIIMILALLLLGFTTPLPLPEERGILIDFGGGGQINAGASSSETPSSSNTSSQTSSNSGFNTQNFEDAPSLPSTNIPNNNNNLTATDTENTNNSNDTKPTNNINNRLSGLNIGGSLSGGSGSGSSGSGSGGGNPGLGSGNNGSGSGPGGIGGSIAGRRQVKKVEPKRKDNMFGKVELKITVDENGNVIDIIVINTNCNECVQPAKDAIKQWKYEPKPDTGYQVGNVTIEFKQT